METKLKIKQEIKSLNQALGQLQAALEQPKDEFIRDSVIKRFEFSFELAWKLMKVALQFLGKNCNSPRTCIRLAGQEKLIKNIKNWLDYQEKRNLSSHVYYEPTAEAVYQITDDFLLDAQKLLKMAEKIV